MNKWGAFCVMLLFGIVFLSCDSGISTGSENVREVKGFRVL